jgi:chromate transporter
VGLLALTVVFARIGAVAFGGIGAALALIDRELVQRRRVLTPDDVTEALTYTKLLPGSTVVQVVSYVGYKLGSWPGSLLATLAFVAPSAALMVVLAALHANAAALAGAGPAVAGLTAAVTGVLLATMLRLVRSNVKDNVAALIALAAFGLSAFAGVHVALIVVAAGILGIVLQTAPAVKAGTAKEAAG